MEHAPPLRSGGPSRSGWRRPRRDRGGFLALLVVAVLLIGRAAVQELAGSSLFIVLPSTLAIVVLITLIVVVGNLVVDLLYAVLDPRVGLQRGDQRTKSS